MELADPTCRQCEGHGLNFPDGTRACPKHTTPEWREHLDVLDQRAKKVTPSAWPYGPNIDVQARGDLLDWAEPLGVKRAGTRCNGLHWLRTGKCPNTHECPPFGWMDHTTKWSLGGEPALVLTQPYKSADNLREKVGDLVNDKDLRVEFKPGWYGHGTTGVFVWRADVHEKLFS